MAVDTSRALAIFEEVRSVLAPFPPDRFWHLVPTAFTERSELYRPAAVVVQINPDDPRDVYKTPGSRDDSLCLHSYALERTGNAIGIDWRPTAYSHDHASEPFICEAHVTGIYTDPLGQRRIVSASAKSDLREGSPTARLLAGGISTARQFICERTESRARNRLIRKVANIPSTFTREELRKPFVAIRWRLDERLPDVRQAMISAGTSAAREIYGAPIDAGEDAPEAEVVETRAAPPGDEPGIAAPAAAAAPPPPAGADVISAAARAEALKRSDAAKPSDAALAALGAAIRDGLALSGKISDRAAVAIRLSLARGLFSDRMRSIRELSGGEAAVLAGMAQDEAGRAQLATVLRGRLELGDPVLADHAAEIREALR